MNVDDSYCEEVMELSASPFLSCSFSSLTVSFHSSLPHFKLRKSGGRLSAVNHMPAITSYVLELCFCEYGCRVEEEEDGGRRQKERRSCTEPVEITSSFLKHFMCRILVYLSFLKTVTETNCRTELYNSCHGFLKL